MSAAEPSQPAATNPVAVSIVLGFDFGERRTGVALGNTLTGRARPLAILSTIPTDAFFASIAGLIAQWQPAFCVVGLPLTDDGQEQPMTLLSRRFARRLQGRFGLRVEFAEEGYSSAEARRGRQGRIDDAAAAIVLEQYLSTLPPA